MRLALGICVLACAGLWGWALFWPKPPEPLPRGLAGEYRFYRFEPPPGVPMSNPFPAGQARIFLFRDDGSYLVRILVTGGYEMMREQGKLEVEGDQLVLTQTAFNGRPSEAHEHTRYRYAFRQDDEGPFLHLTGVPRPYEVYLRRVESQ